MEWSSNSENGAGKFVSNLTTGSLFMMALGFFVYGGLTGAFGMIVFGGLCTLTVLIGLVPYVGVFIQMLVLFMFVVPFVFEWTGLYHTWLTWLEIIASIVLGAIATAITTIAIRNWDGL